MSATSPALAAPTTEQVEIAKFVLGCKGVGDEELRRKAERTLKAALDG